VKSFFRIAALALLALCQPAAHAQLNPVIIPDVPSFEALRGKPFSVQFSVQNPPSGGVNQGWAVTAGTLPAGMSLTSTGLLSGTPTTVQSTTFQVTTTYTFPFYSYYIPPLVLNRTYQFNVDNELVILTQSPLPPATAGVPVNYVISASMPASWSYEVSDLPSSISINLPQSSPTMSLTGVFPPVSAPTTYSIDLYAFGGVYVPQSVNRLFQVTVNPAPSISGPQQSATQGTPYSSAFSASGGTAPLTFSIINSSLPPGSGSESRHRRDHRDANNPGAIRLSGQGYGCQRSHRNKVGHNDRCQQRHSTGRLTDANNATAQALFVINVSPAPLSVLTGALPAGRVAEPYQTSIGALGGVPPYSFSLASGALPPGVSLLGNGTLQGTPAAPGEFAFTVRVEDSKGSTATGSFQILVRPAPLVILTSALPAGTTASAYSVTLAASGGVTPYAWTLASGSLPSGLTLDPATGTISGTPAATGEFPVTVTVTDAQGAAASRSLVIRIFEPLRILTTALPEGTEGVAYQAQLQAAGGAPPYVFSVLSGELPGGLALAGDGSISGAPAASGEFTFTVRVTDSVQLTHERVFTLKVFLRPAIITETLPDGRVGDAYSATLSATGRGPFNWSLSAGALPQGLSLNAQTGAITGTPVQHGDFSIGITVTDGNQPPLSAQRTFLLRIALPPLPPLSITQLQDTTPPASQPAFGLQLGQAFPVELNGTATLSFTPDSGLPPDPAVRFANGGTTVNFTIPAGQTAAVPAAGNLFAFQTGTTAGTITLSVTLRLGATVLEPAPFVVKVVRIPPSGPQITNLVIVRNPAGFEIRVTGYSNIRQVTGATFRFTAAPGSPLQTTEVNVPVSGIFQSWFASDQSLPFGGQFLFVMPFTVQGSMGALFSVQVTLTNSAGSGTATANF
jgi:hypothetical protein